MTDIGTQLARALGLAAAAAGCPVEISRSEWQRWASATFTGARHQLLLSAAEAPTFDTWLGNLDEAEFSIAGHLVADLRVCRVNRCEGRVEAALEALTVETA